MSLEVNIKSVSRVIRVLCFDCCPFLRVHLGVTAVIGSGFCLLMHPQFSMGTILNEKDTPSMGSSYLMCLV